MNDCATPVKKGEKVMVTEFQGSKAKLFDNRMKHSGRVTSQFEKFSFVIVILSLCSIWARNLRANPSLDTRRLIGETEKDIVYIKRNFTPVMLEDKVNQNIDHDLLHHKPASTKIQRLLSANSSTVLTTEGIQVKPGESSNVNATKKYKLKIAWLMSFPNSGTSYTGKLIRTMSMMHTASNYGCEDKKEITEPSIPVYEDQPSGPFYVEVDPHPERSHPTKYILTKTHCGIHCEDCSPRQFLETSFSFRHRCLSSSWSVKNSDGRVQIVKGSYPPARVEKAIHLIRNPFDNIVSRFHLEQHESVHGPRDKSLYGRYNSDRDAFRAFCKALNKKHVVYAQYEFVNEVLYNLTSNIPCGMDFVRYTEWHNLASITTRDLQLDTHTLYYEDYATQFTQTASGLLKFLELEAAHEPPRFETDKSYLDYFTMDEKRRARLAIELMASPLTWQQLKRYFLDN